MLHLSLGHNDEAEEAFNRALNISNRIGNKQLAVSILLERARALSELAQYASALQMYELAIEADRNPNAYAGKGWALERLGKDNTEEARQAYEKAIELYRQKTGGCIGLWPIF